MQNEFRTPPKAVFNWWQGFSTKRFSLNSFVEGFDKHLVLVQIDEVLRGIRQAEFLFQNFGIRMADTERNQRGNIAEYRLPCRNGKLFDVLVGER